MKSPVTLGKKILHRGNRLPNSVRLPIALGIAILITLGMTAVSVAIYSIGGFAKLDLSRPGFERERQEVRQSSDAAKTYDTTSPVTSQALDEFLKEYDGRLKEIGNYGDFRDQSLEDSELQLSEAGTPVPQ